MTKEQLQVITGLLTGMQAATVHLANVICQQTGVSPEDLAESFESTSEAIPQDAANREPIQLVLRQIAAGIRNSNASYDWQSLVDRMLH